MVSLLEALLGINLGDRVILPSEEEDIDRR
jgi:hypothetical protein